MKNSIFIVGTIVTVILIASCSTRRKVGNNQILIEDPIDQAIVIPDSLQMDIQLPDPPNSTIPDTLKK